ncbi:N6-adenosine-methyltransferase non-catalytic subunit-like [Artemia franciscana]|uniref:N(6)-adenosine-methyltransferase non-catalytic subunit METTL14 n=1 Tax=Artemia franciscana TaxID=6661 RepID=A0AA88ID26_ARTSF|nr:hypothetical protein QYM36_000713 [Artemia franciscana]CAG4635490.1 EOG090X07CF [Artemia franciscana]
MDMLKHRKELSLKRKRCLALTLGVESVEKLKEAFSQDCTRSGKSTKVDSELVVEEYNETAQEKQENDGIVYTDSSTFLKGTQSSNPHNDYCQHFVDTGQRPQNFIRDVGLADRFEEYPKLRELIRLKDELIAKTATPPMYLKCDLRTYDLKRLGSKFDVILIEPPLEEYQRSRGVTNIDFWNWDQINNLNVSELIGPRGFVFLWCGSAEGLDLGRLCLKKWGFRRCEDICWIQTNTNNPSHSKNLDPKAVFQRTKEHCLMGIKGTVRRSLDGNYIHANVDIDLIITEQPEYGTIEKPMEIFNIIEHFCLGRRRLHLFGRDSTIRPGWLTVGTDLANTNFSPDTYSSYFANGQTTTGCTDRIEALRPKSPPPKNKTGAPSRGRGGATFQRGRGRGR